MPNSLHPEKSDALVVISSTVGMWECVKDSIFLSITLLIIYLEHSYTPPPGRVADGFQSTESVCLSHMGNHFQPLQKRGEMSCDTSQEKNGGNDEKDFPLFAVVGQALICLCLLHSPL